MRKINVNENELLTAMFPRAHNSEGFDAAEALRVCLYRAAATLEVLAGKDLGPEVDVVDAALGYVNMAQSLHGRSMVQLRHPAETVPAPATTQ